MLQNKLKVFQCSHLRNDSGLLAKYMKIWLNKSTFSTKADNLVSITDVILMGQAVHMSYHRTIHILEAKNNTKEAIVFHFSITKRYIQDIGNCGDIASFVGEFPWLWFIMTIKKYYPK